MLFFVVFIVVVAVHGDGWWMILATRPVNHKLKRKPADILANDVVSRFLILLWLNPQPALSGLFFPVGRLSP